MPSGCVHKGAAMRHVLKGLALILTMAVLFSMPINGMASEEDLGGLTVEELNDWAGQMIAKAKALRPIVSGPQAQKTEDGYEVIYDFATFYLDTPELTENSVLSAIIVEDSEVDCPRGIGVLDTQQTLLSAWANENPALTGSPDFAVLYLSDSLPEEALWGRVQREGQQIQAVQYAVHGHIEETDEYTDCGLLYSVMDGYVTTVRAYGLSSSVPRTQVDETVAEISAIQQEQTYFAYPQSSIGTDLEPFEREDLQFSGLDFLGLTPESAIETLGAYETETWLQDDNGEWLRILQWPKAEITFTYSQDKVFKLVDTLAINQRGMEGPRGVQVDDSLSSVMMRFRHSEGEFDGTSTEVLYGDGQTPPYGLAEYGNTTATLHYVQAVNGNKDVQVVTLHMIFVDTMLSELFLYSW